MDVYTFNKTIDESYEEYKNILLDSYGNEIDQVWKSYLEPGLETTGWNAQWCIPPKLGKFFNILYPEYVLVTVTDVDFQTLTATVDIKEEFSNCEIPDSISEVALYDLLPLKQQDPANALPMMDITALYLHQYRVFKKHLWWPWEEEEESTVWVDVHLKNRLILYYEMMEGKILLETGTLIKDLIIEGKKAYEKIMQLTDSALTDTPEVLKKIIKLYSRVEAIKRELVFYSDPDIRHKVEISNRAAITHDWTHTLVVKQGTTIKETSKLLEAMPQSSDLPLSIGSDLQAAIKSLFTNDSLFLSPGTWELANGGLLELGGTLQGLYTSEELLPIVEDKGYERASWLHFSCNDTNLSNLCLKVKHKYAITVCKNSTLTLNNIHLKGEGLQNGLHLKPGSTLLAHNCVFENLSTVLFVMNGAHVTLQQCVFSDNGTALSILAAANVTLIGCIFKGCSSRAVLVKNSNHQGGQESNVNALNQIDGFEMKDCKFENNHSDVDIV